MAEANDAALIAAIPARPPMVVSSKFVHDLAFVLGLSWLFPRRAARRCLNWPLPLCMLLHLAVGVFGLFVLMAVYAWDEFLGSFLPDFQRNSSSYIFWGMSILLLVEVVCAGLAVVFMAWGGVAVENLRDSFRHSLRQVWLRTPHAVVVSFAVIAAISPIERQSQQWRNEHPSPWSGIQTPNFPAVPSMPESDPGYPAAKLKYDKEMAEFQVQAAQRQQEWSQWYLTQPWYVRNEEPMLIAMFFLGGGWWLGAMLRAVGVRRSLAREIRSSLCLWCGYDLSMTPMDRRCPECGEAVANSLGETAQRGAAWERRGPDGRLGTWRKTWGEALRSPTAFGRSLRIFDLGTDHQRFLLIHLTLIFLLGAAGILMVAYTTGGSNPTNADVFMMVLIGVVVGTMCVLGATLVACGVASIIGWLISLQNKRNLLPASMQVAAYASPFLVAWALLGALLIVCIINLNMHGGIRVITELTGLHSDLLSFLCLIVPNLICGILYILLVLRGTLGARYANR